MASIGDRVLHLLRRDPALLVSKAWRHAQQRLRYARAARRALHESRRPTSSRSSPADPDLLGALGEAVPLLVLERQSGFVRCGLLAVSVPAALSIIWRDFPDARLTLDGRRCPANRAEALKESRNAMRLAVAIRRDGRASSIQIDVFEPTGTESFASRMESDRVAGVLYGDLFPSPSGIVDLTLRMPELATRVNQLPIDVVYTWVDNKDPAWVEAFNNALAEGASLDAVSNARFHSNDELRYSLRSIAMHLSWVNSIHIVSNCRPPEWLDVDHPRLRWLPHEAILPPDCLPTFNSHAIEASLHHIPDLAENFLYLNDDFFAIDHLAPADFVNENGTLNANLEDLAVVNSPPDQTAPDYLNAARNSAELLFERYGYYPTRLHKHAPYSLSRSLLQALEAEFPHAFQQTRGARFRSMTDISVASFLAHHYGFMKRAVVYSAFDVALIKSNDPLSLLTMQKIARGDDRPKVVCINESGTPEPHPQWRDEVVRFMAAEFSVPGEWEREV